MRMSPDFSSFLAHTRTSTISPTLSLRVVSRTFLAAPEVAPSSSKHSVKMVSVTTLKTLPPSSRKVVPWFPEIVIQPSRSSCLAVAKTRITLTTSSSIGPRWISTTSPMSSRRSILLSLMLAPEVRTESFATFMKTRTKLMNLSLGIMPSSSSSRAAKSCVRPSSEGGSSGAAAAASSSPSLAASFSALGSFSQSLKKASHSDSPILPSLSASIAAKSSSFVKSLARWWYLSILTTDFSKASISSCSFLLASSRNLAQREAAFCSLASKRFILNSSFFCSLVNHNFSSCSQPSVSWTTSFLASAASSRASLTSSSSSSANFVISLESMPFAFGWSPKASVSALETLPSADSTSFAASLIFS
mmetsp:Transcript_41424/g.104052  ORF Transcript_41424/g.104052 Transcript_41424/m.104052 type:complete len:361 (-) Transcript_41424:750-1832(-)